MTFNVQEFLKLSAEGKIDSRMKTPTETHPLYPVERAYCAICGKTGGYASQDSSKYIAPEHLIYVCDDCVFTHGSPPLQEAKDVKEIKI